MSQDEARADAHVCLQPAAHAPLATEAYLGESRNTPCKLTDSPLNSYSARVPVGSSQCPSWTCRLTIHCGSARPCSARVPAEDLACHHLSRRHQGKQKMNLKGCRQPPRKLSHRVWLLTCPAPLRSGTRSRARRPGAPACWTSPPQRRAASALPRLLAGPAGRVARPQLCGRGQRGAACCGPAQASPPAMTLQCLPLRDTVRYFAEDAYLCAAVQRFPCLLACFTCGLAGDRRRGQ